MKFKKERVYSAVNADELKPGDKVIVANNLADLKEFVRKNDVHEIEDILSDCVNERFGVCGMANYALAYLVERAENCTNCGHSCKSINPCLRYEPKTENRCATCARSKNRGRGTCVLEEGYGCDDYEPKDEKHTDYNHCEEARKAYACAMTNVCPNKHYRPFKDTDELIKVWNKKFYLDFKPSHDPLTMPYIWVRRKGDNSDKGSLITAYGKTTCIIAEVNLIGADMTRLFTDFEFLDGSVCGVEE